MGRMIDASVLQEEYKQQHDGKRLLLIDVAPTVDAVPVVRCRECKWFEDANEDCGTCGFFDGARSANHYCGEGERKDGERHGR